MYILFSTVESLYLILEYCLFGRLKDYLITCDSVLVELGMSVKLSDYSVDAVQTSYQSTEYVNTLQSGSAGYNSYSKMLSKENSLLNMPSDSGYGDSIAYIPESIDSGYTSWSVEEPWGYLSRDYTNTPGLLYNQDLTNFALQIAHGLQHLEGLKVRSFVHGHAYRYMHPWIHIFAIDISWRFICS